MAVISDEDMQILYEGIETTRLLSAVDQIDELRGYLGDRGSKPNAAKTFNR
jgi:hypothetical protein